MFWHGAPLSRVERLSMASFVANGHRVELHVYDDPQNLPKGVELIDAAQVLPGSAMFRHRRTGSLGPFADWFRYRLLHARGGIWADTDVVCLRPLDYDDPLVFGWENSEFINTAVLGLPAGHPLAAWMADACEEPNRIHPYDPWARRLRKFVRRRLLGNRRDGIRWGEYGPKGFTHAVRHFDLLDRAKPIGHFYPVRCDQWQRLFEAAPFAFNADSRTVHLWHAMMHGQPGFDKNATFAADSAFEVLCRRYGQNRLDSDSAALSMS